MLWLSRLLGFFDVIHPFAVDVDFLTEVVDEAAVSCWTDLADEGTGSSLKVKFADDRFGMVTGKTVKDFVEFGFTLGGVASLECAALGEQ